MPSDQVGTRAHEAPRSRLVAPGAERAFVGRQAELAVLRTGLTTVREAKGAMFLVAGEAGVGKTRLASEFATELSAAGVTVVWGRCWEAGGAPSYWPWVEVIRQLIADGPTPDLGPHARFVAQLAPDLAERLGVSGDDAPSPSDPESARFLMFDAVSTLLRVCAARSPLAVVLDDLHAADRASLLLLTFLARRSTDIRLMLIGTLRDREADVGADLLEPISDFARSATRIELGGLSRGDISSLLEAAPGTDASGELAARIHDATAGNAFFVDEVLRSLDGDILIEGGSTSAPDLCIPSGVREAARRRLAVMTPSAADTLEMAAVVGRQFDAAIVSRALGRAAGEILVSLQHPIELGIVAEVAGGAGVFQFRHALIRDALYDALPAARRVTMHGQVGESIAESAPERYLGELAHHFLVAAPEGDGRFVKHAVHAARRALTRMAFEEAVALYERTLDALRFTPPDERLRCELLLGLAEAKEWANDVAGSRQSFEEAAAIARALGATDLFVRAALGIGAVAARKFTATSRYESAPLLIREALNKTDDTDLGMRALLVSRLALHHLSGGTRSDADSLSAESVALARRQDDSGILAEALIARHSVLFGPDGMEERGRIADEVLEIGTQLLRSDLVMRGHALRFTTRFECGDIRGADHDLEHHRILAERLADPFDQWANLVWRGARLLLEGKFTEAQDHADRAIRLVQSVPGPHSIEVNGPAAYAGQTILIQDTATRDLPIALMTAGYESRFPELSAWHVATVLRHMRANDKESVALEIDRLAAHGFEDFDRNGVWLGSMSILSEAIAFVRDAERAALAYPLLLAYAKMQGTASLVASCGSVSRYLGLLAAVLKQWDQADRHFTEAAALNRAMGARPHLAKTLFDHGRMLIEQANVSTLKRGIALCRQARSLANRLEMQGLLRACDAFLSVADQCSEDPSNDHLRHRLEKAGSSWVIHYAGKQTPVGSTKGMAYIAELLRYPDREILAIDLIRALSAEPSTTPPAPRSATSRGIIRKRRHFTEDVLDAKARRSYQRRLGSLEEELSTAEADGDPERVLELRDEIEQLERELSRGIGLGGRIRQSSDVERARISVTRAIHLAMGRIAEAAPEAGATLARCIRTGTYCCYVPGAEAETAPAEALGAL